MKEEKLQIWWTKVVRLFFYFFRFPLAQTHGDDRFSLVDVFEITVPQGYNHATALADLVKTDTLDAKDENVTDTTYSKATTRLHPGQKFRVKVFDIVTDMDGYDECIAFVKKQGATLVGAQGLTLLYDRYKYRPCPGTTWALSFDEKDALPVGTIYGMGRFARMATPLIPFIFAHGRSYGRCSIHVTSIEGECKGSKNRGYRFNRHILCFQEIK